MPFLFVYGPQPAIAQLCSSVNTAMRRRERDAASDSAIQHIREKATSICGSANATSPGGQVLTELRDYCRNLSDIDRERIGLYHPASTRRRVRCEHAAVLALPLPLDGDPIAGLKAAQADLTSILSSRAADHGIEHPQLVAAAEALRNRYAAEYGNPCPWPGTARMVTYGLRLGCERAQQRELERLQVVGGQPGSTPPAPLAFLALVEPRRTDFAVFGAWDRGNERPLLARGEEDGPSCLAGIGGQMEAGVDATPLDCALREAAEEACVDFRAVVEGILAGDCSIGSFGEDTEPGAANPRYWLRLAGDDHDEGGVARLAMELPPEADTVVLKPSVRKE